MHLNQRSEDGRITVKRDEMGIDHTDAVIDWLLSPNHCEIAIDEVDAVKDWLISPNHSEILIGAQA